MRLFDVEVLAFRKGDHTATIATNGVRNVSQEVATIVVEHQSLVKAIAYLEARGYNIQTSNFQTL